MKKITLTALVLFFAAMARAAVPQLISFQGQLTDPDGKAVTTSKPIEFRLYNVETGGSPIYLESQTVTPDSEGNYSVLIGTVTSLGGVNFNQNIWLQVFVAGEGLLPRYPLASVPYALMAASVSTFTLTNAIGTAQLVDGSVTNAKIAGVDAGKISGSFSSITVGSGGAAISRHLSTSASVSFGATNAASCEDQPVTLANAAEGDAVAIGIPPAIANSEGSPSPQTFFGFVTSGGGSITVRRCNFNLVNPLTAVSGTVRVDVWQH